MADIKIITTVLEKIGKGELVGWMVLPDVSGLICWRKDNLNGEVTLYECTSGILSGSTLNSPIKTVSK